MVPTPTRSWVEFLMGQMSSGMKGLRERLGQDRDKELILIGLLMYHFDPVIQM